MEGKNKQICKFSTKNIIPIKSVFLFLLCYMVYVLHSFLSLSCHSLHQHFTFLNNIFSVISNRNRHLPATLITWKRVKKNTQKWNEKLLLLYSVLFYFSCRHNQNNNMKWLFQRAKNHHRAIFLWKNMIIFI